MMPTRVLALLHALFEDEESAVRCGMLDKLGALFISTSVGYGDARAKPHRFAQHTPDARVRTQGDAAAGVPRVHRADGRRGVQGRPG
jgi:hypothetical protein